MSDNINESLAASVLRLGNECRALADENARLKAEVERLTDKIRVSDNHAQCLEFVINSGTANELRLQAQVERLTKAGEWQTIETAPKDGGTILGYRKGNVFVLHQYYGNSSYEMTHWMPLPSAPVKGVHS